MTFPVECYTFSFRVEQNGLYVLITPLLPTLLALLANCCTLSTQKLVTVVYPFKYPFVFTCSLESNNKPVCCCLINYNITIIAILNVCYKLNYYTYRYKELLRRSNPKSYLASCVHILLWLMQDNIFLNISLYYQMISCNNFYVMTGFRAVFGSVPPLPLT